MKHQTVSRGERRIALWMQEDSAAESCILALHGGPGFTHRYLTPAFASHLGRTAVYFDWPGCGASSRHPGSGYPLAEYVNDIDTVREAAGCAGVILIAHAWAAIPAVEYALAYPAHCRALILVNPLRILTAASQDQEAQARMIAAVDPQVVEPYVQDILPLITRALSGDLAAWDRVDASPWWARMWRTQFLTAPPQAWVAALADTRWGLESYFAHKGRAMMDAGSPFADYDLARRAAQLTIPLLVMGCDSDANYVAPFRLHAQRLHAAVSGSALSLIAESGHFPFIEQPVAYREALSRFLSQLHC